MACFLAWEASWIFFFPCLSSSKEKPMEPVWIRGLWNRFGTAYTCLAAAASSSASNKRKRTPERVGMEG